MRSSSPSTFHLFSFASISGCGVVSNDVISCFPAADSTVVQSIDTRFVCEYCSQIFFLPINSFPTSREYGVASVFSVEYCRCLSFPCRLRPARRYVAWPAVRFWSYSCHTERFMVGCKGYNLHTWQKFDSDILLRIGCEWGKLAQPTTTNNIHCYT